MATKKKTVKKSGKKKPSKAVAKRTSNEASFKKLNQIIKALNDRLTAVERSVGVPPPTGTIETLP